MLFKPDSLWQWLLLAVVLVELISCLGLEGWALFAFERGLNWDDINKTRPPLGDTPNLDIFGNQITDYHPYSRSLPTFLALYIFGMIYMFGISWDALRLKNTIQIIGITVFNWVLFLYGILQQTQIIDATHSLGPVLIKGNVEGTITGNDLEQQMQKVTVAVPVILGVGSVVVSFISWKLYHEFAWTIYKHVSADLQLRKRYMMYEIYIAVLKFDFFFFLAFTMEFLVLLSDSRHDPEFYLTIIAIPVTVLILIAAAMIVRRENKPLQWLVLLFYLVGLAYFLFKICRIWLPSERRSTYAPAARPLTALAVVVICVLILTIAVGWKCLTNFGKGLKSVVNGRSKADEEEDKIYNMNDLPNPNHPTTMGIQSQQAGRFTID